MIRQSQKQLEAFAKRNDLVVLRGITALDAFDAEVCLCADALMIICIHSDRGAAYADFAPTFSPFKWFILDDVMRAQRAEWLADDGLPAGLATIGAILPEVEKRLPFLRTQFIPERFEEFENGVLTGRIARETAWQARKGQPGA